MPFRARVERTVRSIDTAEPQADRRRARVTHIAISVHRAALVDYCFPVVFSLCQDGYICVRRIPGHFLHALHSRQSAACEPGSRRSRGAWGLAGSAQTAAVQVVCEKP